MISALKTFAIDYTYQNDTLMDVTSDKSGWTAGEVVLVALLSIAGAIFLIAAMWRVFTKASRPGWAAIIPIYNTYVMIKIAGKSGWWLLAFFIPVVNIVAAVIVYYNLAKVFGKGVGYTVLLLFLPIIGWPMLAWGSAKYKKPKR